MVDTENGVITPKTHNNLKMLAFRGLVTTISKIDYLRTFFSLEGDNLN